MKIKASNSNFGKKTLAGWNSPSLKPSELTLSLRMAVALTVLLLSTSISFQYLPLHRIALAAQRSPVKKSSQRLAPTSKKININQATLAELKTLPAVGPVIAGRIVDYRKNNPPFRKVEDLLIIKGISQDRLDRIRNRISLE